MTSPSGADRLGRLVALAYLLAALHGLGAADIVGDDEAREAGIVQDVVAGHWVRPTFNGETLPDKPILYHWLAAVPCARGGVSEAAARLPSAVAGAALVGWTARFGATLAGAPAGLAAAGMLATFPALFARARVARPDVVLVLLLALAFARAFAWWRNGRRWDATSALVLLGAATLAKGPVAPALFGTTLLAFAAWERQLYRLPRLLTVAGVAGFAVLGLGWYALAWAGWGDVFVREHLLGRYLGNLVGEGGGARAYGSRSPLFHLTFYPLGLLAIALPWTPLVAAALWQIGRRGGFGDARVRFLVCWALVPVLVFTPAEYKLRYYLLPSLPALAVLAAPLLVELWRRPARRVSAAVAAAAGGIGIAVAALVAWVAAHPPPALARSDRLGLETLLDVAGGAGTIGLAAGVIAAGAAVGVLARDWGRLVRLVAIGTGAWLVLGAPALEEAASRADSLKTFARAVGARPGPLAFFQETPRAVAVYAGRVVPTVHRRADLAPGTTIIAAEPAYQGLARAGLVGPPLLTAEGRTGNLDRGRLVAATVTAPTLVETAPLPPPPSLR